MSVQYIFCAYVTLEPCAHRGKTPSCAELLAELGLSRVVIGARDTNAQAAGGAEILRRGGIEVKFDVCRAAAAELAEPFYLARERFLLHQNQCHAKRRGAWADRQRKAARVRA